MSRVYRVFKIRLSFLFIRYANLSIHLRRKSSFNFIKKFYGCENSFSAKAFYLIPLSLKRQSFQLHAEQHCCTLVEISGKMSFGCVVSIQGK